MKAFRLLAAEQPPMLVDVPKPKAGSGQVVIKEGGAMTWTALLDKRLLRLLPLGATALLGGCNVVVLDPKGQIGEDERSIIMTGTMLMLLVVVPVIMMVFAFAWRYRASNPRALVRAGLGSFLQDRRGHLAGYVHYCALAGFLGLTGHLTDLIRIGRSPLL